MLAIQQLARAQHKKKKKKTPAALLRHVLLNPSGADKVTFTSSMKNEGKASSSPSSFPGNIRETRTRLGLLSVSHAAHKKPPVSPPQAAHTATMRDNGELISVLQTRWMKPEPRRHENSAGRGARAGRHLQLLTFKQRLTDGRRGSTHQLHQTLLRAADARDEQCRPGVHWSRARRRERALTYHVTGTRYRRH